MTDWTLPLRIEHAVAKIIAQQEENGWLFDIDKAYIYIRELNEEMDDIFREVRPLLTLDLVRPYKNEVKKPFLKSGQPSNSVLSWYPEVVPDIGGPFTRIRYEEPTLGSRLKIIKQLSRLGWVPYELTEKGNPKLTEESLKFLEGDLGQKIARYYVLSHRRGQIQGWIDRIRSDGRLTAGANPCGCNTGRMQHRIIVNVPRVGSIFGQEMRSLFIVPEGKVLITHDASGLEARCLAHYMNDKDMSYEILEGDFHTKIWDTIRDVCHSRSHAKNIEYALFYGAGDEKLGRMCDVPPPNGNYEKLGKYVREKIMSGLPAIDELTNNVKRSSKRGYLIGLDGRKLPIRSEHSALNTLLQGAGAILMKMSVVYLDKWINKEGWTSEEYMKVCDMHDEASAEVVDDDKIIKTYSEYAVKSVIISGEYFNFNVPLDAEAQVGTNWSQTH